MNAQGSLPEGISQQGATIIAPENVTSLTQMAQMGKGVARCVAWAENGKSILLVSQIGAFFYDADTLQFQKFIPMEIRGECIPITPDGRTFVAHRMDEKTQTLDVWDTSRGSIKQAIEINSTHRINPDNIALSPQGSWLAVYLYASPNSGFQVWDVRSGKQVFSVPGAFKAAFSPNERFLATLSRADPYKIEIWDTNSFTLKQTIPTWVNGFVLDSDGQWLITTTGKAVQVWDLPKGELIKEIPAKPWVIALPDAAPEFVNAQLWLSLLDTEGSAIYLFRDQVAFSPDSTRVAILKWNENLEIRDLKTQSSLGIITGHTPVHDLAFHPQKPLLAVGWEDNRIWLTDMSSGKTDILSEGAQEMQNVVSFSPKGDILAAGNLWGNIHFWEIASLEEKFSLQGNRGLTNLNFNPQGNRLATASGGTTRLWNLETRSAHGYCECSDSFYLVDNAQKGFAAMGGMYDITLMKTDPDGNVLTNTPGHTLWAETSKGEDVWQSSFRSLVYSPDKRRLAAGFAGWVRLWDVEKETQSWGATAQPLHEFEIPGEALDLAFSPDGKILAAANNQDGVYFRDVETGELLGLIALDHASQVAFSADGTTLVVADSAGIIRFYQIRR